MGNLCNRRNRVHDNHDDQMFHDVDDEDIWLLIPDDIAPVVQEFLAPPRGRVRFQRAVKRIKHLLRLRRIWSRSGSWLNTAASRQPHNARMRAIMTHIFTNWPLTVLRNTRVIFAHLRRERGRLVYIRWAFLHICISNISRWVDLYLHISSFVRVYIHTHTHHGILVIPRTGATAHCFRSRLSVCFDWGWGKWGDSRHTKWYNTSH